MPQERYLGQRGCTASAWRLRPASVLRRPSGRPPVARSRTLERLALCHRHASAEIPAGVCRLYADAAFDFLPHHGGYHEGCSEEGRLRWKEGHDGGGEAGRRPALADRAGEGAHRRRLLRDRRGAAGDPEEEAPRRARIQDVQRVAHQAQGDEHPQRGQADRDRRLRAENQGPRPRRREGLRAGPPRRSDPRAGQRRVHPRSGREGGWAPQEGDQALREGDRADDQAVRPKSRTPRQRRRPGWRALCRPRFGRLVVAVRRLRPRRWALRSSWSCWCPSASSIRWCKRSPDRRRDAWRDRLVRLRIRPHPRGACDSLPGCR